MEDDTADRATLASTLPTLDAPEETPKLAAFDRSGEHFTVGEELGRGGMGRVVAAIDVSLDRAVAIKQILSRDASDLIRFEREVRITARLEHPSIVPIHEAGTDAEGRPYYVMRRIEGEPLHERVAGAADTRARLALVPNMLAVVDAAAFAHARQIIHRDIKPSNILLGAYGETLLIDWGLARRLGEEVDAHGDTQPSTSTEPLTRVGEIYGTVGYMAPEQARGERVDERADVYALGSTLFHVLTGKAPFEGMSAVDRIASAAAGAEVPPIHEIGPEVPRELVTIVGKAMASDLDVRYRDAGELAADLRAFLAGQLVAAHHYTPIERMRRFVRRHRVAVAISTIATVAAITAGIVAVVGIVDARDTANQERDLAEAGRREAKDLEEIASLDRASTLAPIDPTRAVALLRRLPPGSRHTQRARDIAAIAAANGVAHGSTLHRSLIKALAISPDHRSLFSAADDGIMIHDLATGSGRRLATFGRINSALWTDDTATVTINTFPKGIVVFDVPSQTRRPLVPDAEVVHMWIGKTSGHVRYLDTAKVLREISTRGGEPTVLATDVKSAATSGDLAVISDGKSLRILDGDRQVVLEANAPEDPGELAVSRELGRVAASWRTEVVEWSLDGKVRHRWPLRYPFRLVYGARDLYTSTLGGAIFRLGEAAIELAIGGSPISWAGRTRTGVAYVFDDGRLTVIDSLGAHDLMYPQAGTREIATSPDTMYVAAGTLDGTLRWWNLESVLPAPLEVPHYDLCWWNATSLYVLNIDALIQVDRATGATRTVANDPMFIASSCQASLGATYLSATSPRGSTIINLESGAVRQLPGIGNLRMDRTIDVFVFSRGRDVIEIEHGGAPERVRWTAPSEIDAVVSAERWIGVLTVDQWLYRIDRETGAVAMIKVRPVGPFEITRTGAIWFATDTMLWRWDSVVSRLHEFTGPIISGLALDTKFGVRLRDGSIWVIDADGNVTLAGPRGTRSVSAFGLLANNEGNGRLVTRYLLSGESFVRRVPGGGIQGIWSSPDRRSTVITVAGPHVYIFEDVVPAEPERLHAWIESATNAWIDPATKELQWQ